MAEEKNINTKIVDDYNNNLSTFPRFKDLSFREITEDVTIEKYISKVSKAMYSAARRNPDKYKKFLDAADVDVVYFLTEMYNNGIYPNIVTPMLDLYNTLLKDNWEAYEDDADARRMSELEDMTYSTNINITKAITELMSKLKLELAPKHEV